MSDALERELRSMLVEQAQELPTADVHAWLARVDSPYLQRRSRRRAAFGACVALAAAVVLAAVLVIGSSGDQGQPGALPAVSPSIPAAFVGWTPAPSKATARRIAVYAKRCEWAASYKSQLGVPLIADVRGPYTAILFVVRAENYQRYCIYGPHVGIQGSGRLTMATSFDAAPGRDAIQDGGAGGGCDPGTGRAITEMHGEVGRDVTATTFLFSKRTHVAASVRGGFYMAWWPWLGFPREAKLYTTDGPRFIKLFTGPNRGC